MISDARRTAAVLTALPEEMPVVETIELNRDIAKQRTVHVGLCVLNRMPPEPLPAAARRVLADIATADADVRAKVPGVAHIGADLELADRLYRAADAQARHLRRRSAYPSSTFPSWRCEPGWPPAERWRRRCASAARWRRERGPRRR